MSKDNEYFYDLTGLKCPLPVLKTQKKISEMQRGQKLIVRSSDAMSVIDIPHFCRENGHRLLSQTEHDNHCDFTIEKG